MDNDADEASPPKLAHPQPTRALELHTPSLRI
eukprot:gene26588-biopygen16944